MKPSRALFLAIVLMIVSSGATLCAQKAPSPDAGYAGDAKATVLGFAVSPAHLPNPGGQDIGDFFNLSAQAGSHVTLITEWKDCMPTGTIRTLMDKAKERRLAFHLYLSPIALDGGRKAPAIPASAGGTSFSDEKVRAAFKARALELAALGPDYLGLGTEANFLEDNPTDYRAYVSLTQETYRAIKEKYPSQTVTISFQWDYMLVNKKFAPLDDFKDSLDVYSFTTYPGAFGDPDTIPSDYYSCVRKLLPAQRLGFSEVGWSSKAGSSEDAQAKYYGRLPALMEGARPEYVTLALMHDVSMFGPGLDALNSVGVRNMDGTPKKGWHVVTNLTFS